MAFVSDSFTDTDGTNLGSHTGETGATWTIHPSYSVHAKIQSNRAYANGALRCYYASGTPASADYAVEGVIRRVTKTGNAGIAGRVDTSANTMYLVIWQGGANWELYKFVSGTGTQLGSGYNDDPADGTDRTVKLEMIGTAIKVYVDGTERISVTDSAITAAGRAGIRTNTATTTTGYHIDSLTATDSSTTVSRSAAIDTVTGIASAGAPLAVTSRSAALAASTGIASAGARVPATATGSATLTASTGITSSGARLVATLSRSAALGASTGISASGARLAATVSRSAVLAASAGIAAASTPIRLRSTSLTAASSIDTTRSLIRLRSVGLTTVTTIATIGTPIAPGVTSRVASLTCSTLIATDSGVIRLRSAGLITATSVEATATSTRARAAALTAATQIASAWSPLARPAELVVSLSPDALMALGTTSLTTTLDTEATEVELQTA